MTTDVKRLRWLRTQAHALTHGQHEKERMPGETNLRWSLIVFTIAFSAAFIIEIYLHWNVHLFFLDKLDIAAGIGLRVGLSALVLYLLLPFAGFVLYLLRHWRIPPKSTLKHFSWAQIAFSVLALALLIVGAIHHHQVTRLWFYEHYAHNSAAAHAYEWHLFRSLDNEIAIAFVLLLLIMALVLPRKTVRRSFTRSLKAKIKTTKTFAFWLGVSTGELLKRKHKASMHAGQHVTLTLEDACKNILVLGGIGEGKTTRAIHPLLLQLLDQDCGGLIFDIKGDFKNAVVALSKQTQRNIVTIGPDHTAVNLLEGLAPELAASFLKSACLLNQGRTLESFWIETATELCRNSLGVLSFFPEHYNLHGLYRYLFEPEFRDEINGQAYTEQNSLEAAQARLLKNYTRYYETIYSGFDEKVKSGVQATIAQILSPFNHPALVDAFCTQTQNTATFQSMLEGNIFLIDLPLSRWGLGGKVAYTFIKLRFFNLMQQRLTQAEWNQKRPIFFICDEFQEIVSCNKDGLSDLNFWDKARSSKTIGIISAQSISSFYAAIGDRDMTNALLQNFRQKLCFKTEDQATLDYLNRLTGHVEIARRSYSSQSGHTKTPEKWRKTHHQSANESLSFHDKPLLDPQLIRELGPNKAVALLSIAGYSMDDIITVKPVFV